jgi:hypothetical protein
MSLPLILLVIVAPVGAIDMLYFHLWKFRLYSSPRSRAETVTHILRSLTVATLAWVLAHYRPSGAWFWIVGALFLIDFANSLVDVAIEPRSRAALGGVPGAESVIHTVGSTALGAIAALYFAVGWADRLLPTALTPVASQLSPLLVLQGEVVAVSGALLALLELGLLLCSIAGWCLPRSIKLADR